MATPPPQQQEIDMLDLFCHETMEDKDFADLLAVQTGEPSVMEAFDELLKINNAVGIYIPPTPLPKIVHWDPFNIRNFNDKVSDIVDHCIEGKDAHFKFSIWMYARAKATYVINKNMYPFSPYIAVVIAGLCVEYALCNIVYKQGISIMDKVLKRYQIKTTQAGLRTITNDAFMTATPFQDPVIGACLFPNWFDCENFPPTATRQALAMIRSTILFHMHQLHDMKSISPLLTPEKITMDVAYFLSRRWPAEDRDKFVNLYNNVRNNVTILDPKVSIFNHICNAGGSPLQGWIEYCNKPLFIIDELKICKSVTRLMTGLTPRLPTMPYVYCKVCFGLCESNNGCVVCRESINSQKTP